MNDEQLLRYSRHILLPEIDIDGQEKLLKANVLIIGLGGLGSPVALYLASSGVGHLTLVDFDVVDASNLQRQIAHTTKRIGETKVASAAQALYEINPAIRVSCVDNRLGNEGLIEHVALADVVIDCSDNLATRFAINLACFQKKIPLVSGAAIRLEGQVTVFDARIPNSPCYHCLYDSNAEDDLTCVQNGVLAPIVGVIGSMQALEAIKIITGFGKSLVGRLQLFDARENQWRELRLPKDQNCPVCTLN